MTERNFYKLFVGYFIFFGIIISIVGAGINYYLQIGEMNKSLTTKASEIFKLKNEIILKGYISNIDNIVKSLINNQFIGNNLLNKKELEYIKKTSTKQMYINDLINLRKDLEKDFI